MRIAIPSTDGRLCTQFDACREFALIDLDESTGLLRNTTLLSRPPPAEPLPHWLRHHGVHLVLAGTVEFGEQQALCASGLRLVTGAPAYRIEAIVARFLMQRLEPTHEPCGNSFTPGTPNQPLSARR